MKKYIIIILFPLTLILYECEPDHETVDVSDVSQLPKFSYNDGQFISFVKGSRASFTDPGATAYVDDKEVRIVALRPDSINTQEANVYVIYYFAQNDDGIISEGRRIVAITHEPIRESNLEGKYRTSTSYGWPAVEAKVRKKNDAGWYSCTEILGFPGVETKGEFVDIGRGELYLLPGESFFGDYDISDGDYTFTSLSWSVFLIDDPYAGIEIPVVLIKTDE